MLYFVVANLFKAIPGGFVSRSEGLLRKVAVHCFNCVRFPLNSVVAGDEATFLLCSFWLVDCLIMLGRRDDALNLFNRQLNVRNDLGVLAEEYDSISGRQLGNFPQAFPHIGLVNSVVNLSRAIAPLSQRTDTEPSEVAA